MSKSNSFHKIFAANQFKNILKKDPKYRLALLIGKLRNVSQWHTVPAELMRVLRLTKWPLSKKDWQHYCNNKALEISIKRLHPSSVFQAASSIAQHNGWDIAYEFSASLAPECVNSLNIIRANKFLSNDDMWLTCLNNYLEHFNQQPVKLSQSSGSKFSRLESVDREEISSQALISVIMPAFNSAESVTHAANSILRQSWKNLELIIIDDCSTDDTWQKVKKLAQLDKRVKIFRNKINVGPYVSKNIALQIARGDYVTGQDADDWSHPDRLNICMQYLLYRQHEVKAIICNMLRVDTKDEFCRFDKLSIVNDGVSRSSAISLFVEMKYFKENLGYWDSVRFGADGELIQRAQLLLGEKLQYLDAISMIGLDHANSLTNHPEHGVDNLKGKSSIRQMYFKHYNQWHKESKQFIIPLQFPPTKRHFEAPQSMLISLEDIQANLHALKEAN